MTKLLAAVFTITVLVAAPAGVSADGYLAYVSVYPDEAASTCEFSGGSTIQTAYVIVTNSIPLQQITFQTPVPDCVGAFVLETSPFVTTGNSQDGVTVDLGGCETSPLTVLTVYYSGENPGLCCYWPAHGVGGDWIDLEIVDCDGVTRFGRSAVGQNYDTPGCCEEFDVLAPYQPSPPDGATDVPLDVTLTWVLPDNRCFPWIQLDDTPPPGSNPPAEDSGYLTNYTPAQPLEPNTTYYWRIQLQCSYDRGSWSDVWTFTTGDVTVPTESVTWGGIKALYEL